MITNWLIENDPSLEVHLEAEFSADTKGYTAFNDAGIECETGEFLYSLIRLTKPERVLETGTHQGIGASYMGKALKDNGFGVLDTYEFLQPHFEVADKRIRDLELEGYVRVHLQDVGLLQTFEPNLDLILLDTEPQTRFAELVKFEKFLNPGGFIFIHDLHRGMSQGNINPDWPNIKSWPFGDIPSIIKEWVKKDKLRPFHFSTPRGLTGFYKVHEGDFKW